MKSVAFIANGQIDSVELIKSLASKYERVIAVDGGLIYCKAMGIRPDLIVGDFDSCPEGVLRQYEDVPKIHLAREKDETDLEVAIEEARKKGFEKGTVFGGWGRRIDHSLTNALLLARFPGVLALETENELVFAITKKAEIHCFAGQTMSLIPLSGPADGITTKGLKWELKEGRLDQQFIGVSNVCLGERVAIRVKSGALLCSLLKS